MAERPIIFGTWAIPKLLDGSKTQTRRTRGLEKINAAPDEWFGTPENIEGALWRFSNKDGTSLVVKCPYGVPGDQLWVREAWAENDRGQILRKSGYEELIELFELPDIGIKWRSPIHMFRSDSRIDLKITSIKAERVQEITEEDARAEGVPLMHTEIEDIDWYRPSFTKIWDSLDAKRYPFSLNPWEWPITFELVK